MLFGIVLQRGHPGISLMPTTGSGTAYSLGGLDKGSVVTLIHGLGVNRLMWEPFETALANHYRVLSYDLLGHGGSSRPDEPLSLQLFSDQLRDLLNDLNIERCAVLGFSLGGMINRRFAMDHPGRTSALVILNSPHERTAEAQELVEERVRDTATGGPGATIDASMKRWFTPQFLATDDPIIHKVKTWILGNDPRTYTEARQVLASGVTELIRPVQPIETPALVITCENDSGSSPEMTYAISREIKGSRAVIIPGLQHMGLSEQPEMFISEILRFLRTVELPPA